MTVPQGQLERRTHLYWHITFCALVVAGVGLVVGQLAVILTPLIAALALCYLLDPLVRWAQRRVGLPRWAGTALLALVMALLTVLVVLLVVPIILRELQTFGQVLPLYGERVRDVVLPWMERVLRVEIPRTFADVLQQAGSGASTIVSRMVESSYRVIGGLVASTAGLFSTIATLLLIPVFTLYLLPRFPEVVGGVRSLIPVRWRATVIAVVHDIDRALAAWIRGQLAVMGCLAVVYSVGLAIVGIKMAVLIGTITGLMAFVPYIGFAIGATLAVVVTLLDYHGLGTLIGVAAVLGIGQVLDGLLLTPRLVGNRVGFGPIGVLVALLVGGKLFGFVGALIAVPVGAALFVVLKHLVEAYRHSAFFERV